MKRIFETSMLSAFMVAAGIVLASSGSFAQSADQLKQMSVEQLLQRQQVLQTEVDKGGDKKKQRQLRRVQRELKRRKNQAAKPQPTQQQQQAQPKKVQPAQQQQVQPQQQDQSAAVNRQARRYLRNKTNVRDMNASQLRTRIRNGRSLLQEDGLRGKLKRQVQQQVRAARAESARRSAVVKKPPVKAVPQQQVQPQQKDQSAAVNRQARRYLRNKTNVRDMNASQLRTRIRNGRSLLQEDGLRGKLKRQVQQQVRAARAESARRSAVVKKPPVKAVPQQQVQPQQQDQSAAVNRQARRYLRNRTNVRDMNNKQLRARIRDGRELLQRDGLRKTLEVQVRDEVRAARAESDRRSQAAQQPADDKSNVNAEARDLLADNRPAASLRDPQLRRRLDRARRIMRDRDLNRRLFRQLRRMARTDRDELRDRIARRDRNRAERREDRQDARQLLRDRRDVRDLSDRQLQARITSARDLLASDTLRPGQKQQLRDLLREARREKRRRLIAGRAYRRERLRRNRANNQIIIQIPPVRIGPDRDDIAAAEADDELLEQQLVAPPRRRIERRYSRQDFRTGRTLSRDTMPAIEVDTIRFGFNEAFVREEEIPQLERIGEIIERIVAGNPDEVFLIEGHTDAVGSAAYNQGLSSKRANAVRDAMLQFFNVESNNIETVGYGERFLKINTPEAEPENRRVTIRRITPLLASQ